MAKYIFSVQSISDLRKKFAAFLPTAQRWHSLIWPDYEVPKQRTPRSRVGKEEEQKTESSLFIESTIPTSMVFASLVACIVQPKRRPVEKARPLLLFRKLVEQSLVDCEGEETILLRGSLHGPRQVFMNISANAHFKQKPWDDDMDQLVKSHWQQALLDSKCPWVTSYAESPHVADVIIFALTPTPTNVLRKDVQSLREFRSAMEKPAYFLIGLCARRFEKNILSVTLPASDPTFEERLRKRQLDLAEGKSHNAKRIRISTAVCFQSVSSALDSLYSSKATLPDKSNIFLTFL